MTYLNFTHRFYGYKQGILEHNKVYNAGVAGCFSEIGDTWVYSNAP
jgi:hypothetical protein